MDDELTQLIRSGPDPTRELQHLVMTRYHDITAARQLARSWGEIARTLQIEGRHKSLAAAYWRVRRGIEAKRLNPPKVTQHPARPTQTAQVEAEESATPQPRRGFKKINVD